jgi:hypothetical protein
MSRLDRLKESNPELNISLIDIIASCEPTKTYKYMDFLIKNLKDEHIKNNDYGLLYRKIVLQLFGADNLLTLIDFENHLRENRIEKNDIGSYRNFKDIIDSVKNADQVLKLKQVEKEVIKLYNTDFWLVLIPLSFEASKVYGYNTKWCTTQFDHWEKYKKKCKLIYIIDKKANKKWAISVDITDGEVSGWLSNDDKAKPENFPFTKEIFSILITEIEKLETITQIVERMKKQK